MYGGAAMANYACSMVDLAYMMAGAGIGFSYFTLSNESLIQRARNLLVHRALTDGQTTHVLLVDADIGFYAPDVLKLMEMDVDVLCGAYSRKCVDWERVRQAALAGLPQLEQHASSTFVEGLEGPLDIGQFRERDMIEIRRAGTGFMLLKRAVFERLRHSGQVRSYSNNMSVQRETFAAQQEPITAFFDCPVDPHTQVLLSEDFYFCDAWRRAGGRIFLAPWVRLTHFGTYCYI